MHVAAPNEVHVAKMVSPCTDAAYVTAVFDSVTTEATRLVGGRLTKDGTQLPQAYLDFDYAARRLDIRLGDPASEPIEISPPRSRPRGSTISTSPNSPSSARANRETSPSASS